MNLAIFDLDNTLLLGDSDYAWGQFLVEQHVIDSDEFEQKNERFYADYREGTLDIFTFLSFALRPLADNTREDLDKWHAQYMQDKIMPMISPAARELVEKHRRAGDTLMIITATNSFVTRPIATEFGVSHLLATEPEVKDGKFTGKLAGTPCFQEGKLKRLQQWMKTHDETLAESWFYSDSHNDLVLLNAVAHPVAVNPDQALREQAGKQSWPIIEFK